MSLVLGTRGSKLALAQSSTVLEKLRSKKIKAEKKIIATRGDNEQNTFIHEIEGDGVFASEIDSLVFLGDIDAGVHSMKDIPNDLPGDVRIVSVIERGEPYDVLVTRKEDSLDELKQGATVGTSSIRRKAQLLWQRPDLSIKNLRGNVDTRINKLRNNSYDGIVLAEAGLRRLKEETEHVVRLPFLPAANQGAIAITARYNSEAAARVEKISHKRTFLETSLERKIIEKVGGGCDIPLGVIAKVIDDDVKIEARIIAKGRADEFSLSRIIAKENADEKADRIGDEISQWREKYI